jgi:hypothetical protein
LCSLRIGAQYGYTQPARIGFGGKAACGLPFVVNVGIKIDLGHAPLEVYKYLFYIFIFCRRD